MLERVEERELVGLAERRVIGGIVGRAGKAVEGEDRATKARGNEPGGDGKVLVVLGLAGLELGTDGHRFSGSA